MKSISNIAFGALVLVFLFSCGRKAFPDDRFVFTSKFRNLISPYHAGDTLHFENSNKEMIKFKIIGTDSLMHNIKGGFINPGPSKYIQVYYEDLAYIRPRPKDTSLVLLNIYPDTREESCHFSLLNFRGEINGQTDSLLSEFRTETGKTFNTCFVIKNVARDLSSDPRDIEYIYVQQTEGIIALKSYNGTMWEKR